MKKSEKSHRVTYPESRSGEKLPVGVEEAAVDKHLPQKHIQIPYLKPNHPSKHPL